MNATQISALTTAELVKLYNEKTGKSIKKFSSRAAGEKQVAALFANKTGKRYDSDLCKQLVQSATAIAAKKTEEKTKAAPKAERQEQKKAAPKAERQDRSAAISESWKDPSVAAKRAERTQVKAANKVYRSVREAFLDLHLPLTKHIKFRMELKQTHELTFKHEGRAITFHVVADE